MLFGGNEMGVSMPRSDEQIFYGAQAREGERGSTASGARRSILNTVLGRSDAASNHRRFVLRKERCSHELGWTLGSFGRRSDYPRLTERPEFALRDRQRSSHKTCQSWG
jgi:hypothetical protein